MAVIVTVQRYTMHCSSSSSMSDSSLVMSVSDSSSDHQSELLVLAASSISSLFLDPQSERLKMLRSEESATLISVTETKDSVSDELRLARLQLSNDSCLSESLKVVVRGGRSTGDVAG